MEYRLLHLERRGDVFILTLCNGDENRLNVALCQEIIRALGYVRDQLGQGPGALIVRGNNAKFFTNVGPNLYRRRILLCFPR